MRAEPTPGRSAGDSIEPGAFGKSFVARMASAEVSDGRWSETRLVPVDSVMIGPTTIALHYAQSVFEGLKAFRGVGGQTLLFRVHDHFRRMNRSARRLGMPEIPEEVFVGGIEALVRAERRAVPDAPGHALYLRPLYYAAERCIGVRVSSSFAFQVLGCPVGAYHRASISLLLSRANVRSHEGGTGDVKAAGNYAACLLATRAAQAAGYDDVLWVDARTRERVEECGTMNVFFVLGDAVVTPPAGGTILPGITRASALELLRVEGIEVVERPVCVDELVDAHRAGALRECFGTGTAASVKPVERIGVEGREELLLSCARGSGGKEEGVAAWLAERLEAIRTARHPAPPGWVVEV